MDQPVALVTGAARGIGAAVADRLRANGYLVAGVDLAGADHECDVADPAAVEGVVAAVERDLGPVTALANVAGVLRPAPVVEITDEDWARTLAVNATGAMFVSRAVARRMLLRRSGSIVTVGSNAAGLPRTSMGAYAASKAASTALTLCLGLELAPHGIRCNVVSPGSTDTDMQRSLWTGGDAAASAAAVIAGDPSTFRLGIPLGRIAEPSDVADAVAFLLSEQARHITLQNLYVDGGASLQP